MGKYTISIREALRKLSLPTEHDLHAALLTQPFFLTAWAEFRDDLLWGKPDASGLSDHIFLKCVVPAAVRELLNPDGPSEYYIPRHPPSHRPDKTPYILSDHYVRLILQVLPPLQKPDHLFHGRARDEHDLTIVVEALGYLVHVLRHQYRPGRAGLISRTLQRLAPASRHAVRARQFDNPRHGSDTDSHGGRAATDGPAATSSGTEAGGLAARRVASVDPGMTASGSQLSAPAPPSPSSAAPPHPRPLPRRFPPPMTPAFGQQQQQQQEHRQHQQQCPTRTASPGPSSSSSSATAPAPASAPASHPVMGVSTRRFKRSRSEEDETSLHDVPAKAGRADAGTNTNTDASTSTNTSARNAEERTLEEVLFGGDEGAVVEGKDKEGEAREVGKLVPRQLVLLEQVRLAGRGYGAAERGVGADGPGERKEIWRRRCEGVLRELREVGEEEVEAVWEGLEDVKREWIG